MYAPSTLRFLRAADGQEPECLGGHGWPREADVAGLLPLATLLQGFSSHDAAMHVKHT